MSDDIRDIQHRLSAIERAVARREGQHDEVMNGIRRLQHLLEGNGGPGMTIRLDRVEQIQRRQGWFAGVLITALVGLVAAVVLGAL
jgi:hypothetical protein